LLKYPVSGRIFFRYPANPVSGRIVKITIRCTPRDHLLKKKHKTRNADSYLFFRKHHRVTLRAWWREFNDVRLVPELVLTKHVVTVSQRKVAGFDYFHLLNGGMQSLIDNNIKRQFAYLRWKIVLSFLSKLLCFSFIL
jgi:hypothetical protein